MEPYHKYRLLLDILFNFLKTEQTRGFRREVIQVLGLLETLDPYKRKQHRRAGQKSKMNTPISKPMDKRSQQSPGMPTKHKYMYMLIAHKHILQKWKLYRDNKLHACTHIVSHKMDMLRIHIVTTSLEKYISLNSL